MSTAHSGSLPFLERIAVCRIITVSHLDLIPRVEGPVILGTTSEDCTVTRSTPTRETEGVPRETDIYRVYAGPREIPRVAEPVRFRP